MIKVFKNLGDTWYEVLGSLVIILLFAPIIVMVIVGLSPFIIANKLWSWMRREPKPDIPKVLDVSTLEVEQIAALCAVKAKKLVKSTTVKKDEKGLKYVLTSQRLGKRSVHFGYDDWGMSISIDGLNCYEWDTSQSDSIDLYFWIVVGALRNGVYPSRSKLGRLGYWTKCDELNVWARIQREGSSYDGIDFYIKPPAAIQQRFQETASEFKAL